MRNYWQHPFLPFIIALLVIVTGSAVLLAAPAPRQTASETPARMTVLAEPVRRPVKKAAARPKGTMRTPMDWQQSSETKPYPNVAAHPHLWIKVSLAKQRVYFLDGQTKLYTMYASTGVDTPDSRTPTGTYTIEAERGHFFFNGESQEGAYYYVSWKDHGVYLFHSTPTDANGKFNTAEAANLGVRPSSHGCIRLTVADAKWLYEHIRFGTRVVIE